jgi:ankyrin repeat protein
MIKLLLERGAQADALDADGLTPLLHLSRTRSKADPVPVMELLAASGADVDARDETQGTLLMYFARRGHAGAVRWLLAQGSDRQCAVCRPRASRVQHFYSAALSPPVRRRS